MCTALVEEAFSAAHEVMLVGGNFAVCVHSVGRTIQGSKRAHFYTYKNNNYHGTGSRPGWKNLHGWNNSHENVSIKPNGCFPHMRYTMQMRGGWPHFLIRRPSAAVFKGDQKCNTSTVYSSTSARPIQNLIGKLHLILARRNSQRGGELQPPIPPVQIRTALTFITQSICPTAWSKQTGALCGEYVFVCASLHAIIHFWIDRKKRHSVGWGGDDWQPAIAADGWPAY